MHHDNSTVWKCYCMLFVSGVVHTSLQWFDHSSSCSHQSHSIGMATFSNLLLLIRFQNFNYTWMISLEWFFWIIFSITDPAEQSQFEVARPKWSLIRPSSSAHMFSVRSNYMVCRRLRAHFCLDNSLELVWSAVTSIQDSLTRGSFVRTLFWPEANSSAH